MSIKALTEVTFLSDRYNLIVAEIRGGEQLRFDREFTVVMTTYSTVEEGSCHIHQVDAELREPPPFAWGGQA